MILPSTVKKVCFTGHRDLSADDISLIENRLPVLLDVLVRKLGAEDFYAGGAIGFDMLASFCVLSARDLHEGVRLHLLIPCANHDSKWSQADRLSHRTLLLEADTVSTLSPHYYRGCMHARNRALLDASELCIAFLREGESGGGSFYTVSQAKRRAIPVINIASSDFDVLLSALL